MHGRMVGLQRYRPTSGKRNFVERINTQIFLEAVLAISIRPPIYIKGENQPQHLKRRFFHKNRPILFHINSTGVITLVKQNLLSFSSTEIKSHFLPQSTVSCRTDSRAEVNSNCCHRSDA